ncbi:MAG TPA: copper chaperone PCu(A)C [Candidatus Binatia bacterium]|nr:copper chaperone PCu(A)C [Candidatus Binatia bacterium]
MRILIAALLVALTACGQPSETPRGAEEAPAAALRAENAWAAPTPGGVDVSAGYLTLVNDAAAEDVLLSASSARAERVEVHEMTMEGGVMQMRAVARLAIPAGQSVELAPSGRHLMFYGVTQPFAVGETIPVRLTFERAGDIDVSLPVRRPGASTAEHNGH